MLYLFRQQHSTAYRRITATVRQMVPDFDDFVLEPSKLNDKQILLNWTHKGRPYEFGPHQLSDGTLRAMCLVTLLMQPEEGLPNLVIVDEPELGLHPYALNVVAAMFAKASHHAQILISTQSSTFLSNFSPEDIIVVSREGPESRFARPDSKKLAAWLDEYSLGDVWEKNVIGGGPH